MQSHISFGNEQILTFMCVELFFNLYMKCTDYVIDCFNFIDMYVIMYFFWWQTNTHIIIYLQCMCGVFSICR